MRVPFQGGLASVSPLALETVATEARAVASGASRRVGKTEALRDLISNPNVEMQVKPDGR